MLNDIYNKRIIELAGNIPRLGRLPDPHASATAHSKLCGSTVKVGARVCAGAHCQTPSSTSITENSRDPAGTIAANLRAKGDQENNSSTGWPRLAGSGRPRRSWISVVQSMPRAW